MRYKTCSICGIVPETHNCPYKRKYKFKREYKKDSEQNKFRSSAKWTKKSIEIRERDKYLCQVCYREKYNTVVKLNFTNLEVHHIVPLEEDYNKRLDNYNLITLCQYHHKQAENNNIPKEYLLEVAKEQEQGRK